MKFLGRIILRYRIFFLLFVAAVTAFMGFKAKDVEITYFFAKLLPDSDTASIDYEYFKSKFGQDGSVLVIGTDITPLKKLDNFNAWCKLGDKLKATQGIENVLSVGRLQEIVLNDSAGKFEMKKLFTELPKTQQELDAIWEKIITLKFYDGIIFNSKTNSTLIAVTFNKRDLNTKNRLSITDSLKAKGDAFSKQTGIELHYSGMPYIRTNVARKIQHETTFFLALTIIATGLVLFFFFRSFYPVIFSLLVVSCGVVFSVGLLVLFGFKLTAMSAIIPPLIIVIGVPNCILILNKYHTEFAKHGNKMKALHIAIERSSVSLFFANFTTAIGFAVFCTIKNYIFFEFGLVSSISVMATYIFSMMIVPAIFSFLPAPPEKHIKHIEGKKLTGLLTKIDHLTTKRRTLVYVITVALCVVAGYGLIQLKAIGYVVDDLPKKDPILTDLHYFEDKNGGVLPFEITINTKRENGVFSNSARALYRINKMQKVLAQYPEFSKPLSVTEGVKFAYQAYKGGDPKYYRLPSVTELKKVAEYMQQNQEGAQKQLLAFIDSTRKVTRVSANIKDVGSVKIKQLLKELKPRVDSAFNYDYEANKWMQENERYDVRLTGNCVMFLKGNEFLVNNLLESVVLAIILIAILMFTLFASPRMILISIIPSLIALLITAGIMGYLHVPLKPSTILVFSIAFGISSDGTLYFLTKYRYEMRRNKLLSISKAVSLTIHETGISMIYTAIILTTGFAIFGFSDFGGTAALGILLSLTLLIAYTSNLILLPCFLLSLEKSILKKEILNVPVFDIETEDEEDEEKKDF